MAVWQNVFIFFVLASVCYQFFRAALQRRRWKAAKAPPGPRGLPILGNALDLAKDPHLIPTFNKWYRKYGPIVGISILGQKQVVISSEEMANDLFSRRGNIYSDRGTSPAIRLVSDGLLPAIVDKTETWRKQRKLMHSVISISENARFEPFMDLESKYTIFDLLETPEKFDDHLSRYAYGVITRAGFGIKTDSIQDPLTQEVQYHSDFLVNCFRPDKYLCNLVPWLLKAPRWLCSEFDELDTARKRMQKHVLGLQNDLKEKAKNGAAPDCLQRFFIEHQNEFGLSDLEGGTAFYGLLMAGTRSPHNSLLGYVIAMLKHPEWQKKLQDEIDSVVGSERLPEFADMPNLPTVRAVILEVIRCRSVDAEIGIPHKLSQDDVYDGYFFQAGTVFHANVSAMLSDPEMYPDGETFNPARWLDPSYPTYKEPLSIHPNLQGRLSFGFGRRACPGTNFTERSITIMVARFAWACNIKRAVDPATKEEVELNIEYEPVANPRPYPFPAVVEPRSQRRLDLVSREAEQCRLQDPLMASHKS